MRFKNTLTLGAVALLLIVGGIGLKRIFTKTTPDEMNNNNNNNIISALEITSAEDTGDSLKISFNNSADLTYNKIIEVDAVDETQGVVFKYFNISGLGDKIDKIEKNDIYLNKNENTRYIKAIQIQSVDDDSDKKVFEIPEVDFETFKIASLSENLNVDELKEKINTIDVTFAIEFQECYAVFFNVDLETMSENEQFTVSYIIGDASTNDSVKIDAKDKLHGRWLVIDKKDFRQKLYGFEFGAGDVYKEIERRCEIKTLAESLELDHFIIK